MAAAITQAQRELLKRMTSGCLLWSSIGAWWLVVPNEQQQRAPGRTAEALARRGLIEPTSYLYWQVTDTGRAALAEPEGPK